jgi:hypothetical protein
VAAWTASRATVYARPSDLYRLAEERSLAYHRQVAELLALHPEMLASFRARAFAWATSGESHAPYGQKWLALLDGPFEQLLEALVDPSERARALRQSTPFAGAIGPRERWRIWREVREQMESQAIASGNSLTPKPA